MKYIIFRRKIFEKVRKYENLWTAYKMTIDYYILIFQVSGITVLSKYLMFSLCCTPGYFPISGK